MYKNPNNNFKINEDEINLRELFQSIFRYKWSILLISFISVVISIFVAYYKPDVYEAKSTVEVGTNDNSKGISKDAIQDALKGFYISNADIDTQIAIIKSRFIILDAMKQVNLTTHIWGVNRFLKKVELYKDSPISFKIIQGKEFKYVVTPIDNKKFKLSVEGIDANTKARFKYEDIRLWGEDIKSKYFEIIINKTFKHFDYKKYILSEDEPLYTAEYILENSLSVRQIGKEAKILEISYTDVSPLRTKEFVNALTKTYIKQNIKVKTQVANQTLNFINRQLSIIQKKLKESENRLQMFKIRNRTIDIKESSRKISDTLADYENRLRILNMKIDSIQNLYIKIKNGRNLEYLTLAGTDFESNSLNNLIIQLQQAVIKRIELLKDYTPAHPDVKKITVKIESLKRLIKTSIKNVYKNLIDSRVILTKSIKKYQKELENLPKMQQEYLKLERNFAFNEKFYSYLLEKRTETKIKKAATVNQNRIIDLALLPIDPIKPNRKLVVIMGLVFGMLMGIILAFIRAYLDNTIKSENDVLKRTLIPIFGVIPRVESRSKSKMNVTKNPKSLFAEAFVNLRINLKFDIFSTKRSSKVIVVTSTVRGEGRSLIGINLAAIYAMINKKVIFVDFDLRSNEKIYKVQSDKGISDYLTEDLILSEAIQNTTMSNLDIMYSGNIPANPSKLISSIKTKELFDYLREIYDIIIVDTSPIGTTTDARLLIPYANSTLYILRANYSKKEFIKNINRLFNQDKIKRFAIVLNDVTKSNFF